MWHCVYNLKKCYDTLKYISTRIQILENLLLSIKFNNRKENEMRIGNLLPGHQRSRPVSRCTPSPQLQLELALSRSSPPGSKIGPVWFFRKICATSKGRCADCKHISLKPATHFSLFKTSWSISTQWFNIPAAHFFDAPSVPTFSCIAKAPLTLLYCFRHVCNATFARTHNTKNNNTYATIRILSCWANWNQFNKYARIILKSNKTYWTGDPPGALSIIDPCNCSFEKTLRRTAYPA